LEKLNLAMKTLLILAALVASELVALAQTNQASINLQVPVQYTTDWKPNPALYRSVLSEKSKAPVLTLGHKEYSLHGPVVELLRPPRTSPSDDFVDAKLRRIPILSLIVPYKMASPPEGKSKYFRWKGESSQPWHAITQVAPAGASGDNRIHTQPSGSLISVSF
jgi:hypothetical protein